MQLLFCYIDSDFHLTVLDGALQSALPLLLHLLQKPPAPPAKRKCRRFLQEAPALLKEEVQEFLKAFKVVARYV